MGPEAAVNAVYANKIEAIEDADERAAFVAERRTEYEADVDLLRLASDLVIDAIVEPERPAREIIAAARRGGGQGPALQHPPPRRTPGLSGRHCRPARPCAGMPRGGDSRRDRDREAQPLRRAARGRRRRRASPRRRADDGTADGAGRRAGLGRAAPTRTSWRAGRSQSPSRHNDVHVTSSSASMRRSSGQRQADHVGRVTVDPLDERTAEAVEGESTRDQQRLAGGDVGLDRGVVEVREPDHGRGDGRDPASSDRSRRGRTTVCPVRSTPSAPAIACQRAIASPASDGFPRATPSRSSTESRRRPPTPGSARRRLGGRLGLRPRRARRRVGGCRARPCAARRTRSALSSTPLTR